MPNFKVRKHSGQSQTTGAGLVYDNFSDILFEELYTFSVLSALRLAEVASAC